MIGENSMNERIRELAEQAKKYSIDKLDETGELHKYYDVYFEKFAELIVAECANLIDSMDHSSQYFPHVADAIKEHFGVER
jgi:hypothetical protein